MRLLVMLFTQPFHAGMPHSTIIGHFLAALGIYRSNGQLLSTAKYTQNLSSLIWIGRVVLLEYTLPTIGYSS